MRNLYLKDGRIIPIIDERDFSFLIEEYMGDDSKQYFDELYNSAIEENAQNMKALEDEFHCYEGSVEVANRICNDIDDLASQLVEDIENAKRLNRNKIIKSLEEIIKLAKEAY